MNKYQEAYSYIKHYCELDDECVGWPLYQRSINSLKELVDKATPIKPVVGKRFPDYLRCPNCNEFAEKDGGGVYKYCPYCGQKLDWRDEDEQISRSIK